MTKWGKVTYNDGSYVVGPFDGKTDCLVVNYSTFVSIDGRNFEFIDAPKPIEPRGLGAVVKATIKYTDSEFTGLFVRGQDGIYGGDVWENDQNNTYEWADLENIEILSEGYKQ